MSGAPAHSIFCCTDAKPVLTESSLKIHNDPNRDVHDRICTSFMEFALRQQRAATVYALLKAQIGELEAACENEIPSSMSHSHVGPSSYRTPLKSTSGSSMMTPPFTPDEMPTFRGKGKQPLFESSRGSSDIGSHRQTEPSLAHSLARLQITEYEKQSHNSAPHSNTDVQRKEPMLLSGNKDIMNFPQLSTAPQTESDSGKSAYNSARNESSAGAYVKQNACSMVHDHIMEIPTMPLPNQPSQELLRNPLTPDVQYCIHLTSRHDYGPVYSHRYFVCPQDLTQDWTELTLLQWFARGESFKMKAEKWDIKCPNDSRFFRMTLRPNLDLRSYE